MAISTIEALQNYRYVYFGFQSHPTPKNPWQATPTMAVSDNLVKWDTVTTFKELEGLRDGFVKKIDDYYYVIGTGGFYKTTDFISFEKLTNLDTSKFVNVWAPEIFQDTAGKYHIVYCAGDDSKGILDDYIADFDPETDTISNQEQAISFMDGAIDNSCKIDPDICVIDGVYFLSIGGNYVFSSNNYLGPYQRFPVNFAPAPQKYSNHDSGIPGWVEGPNMFVDGDSVRLFADQTDGNGLVFRSAVYGDLFDWSRTEKTHAQFKMRHGSILVNEKVSAQTDEEIDNTPKVDDRLTIQGLHASQPVLLTCYMKNSFQYQYEDNQTNQIQFVAYNDGSPSFAYIANESTIEFNDDLFIIKNIEEDDEGTGLYTVTAIQYINSEIGRVMQRNVNAGVLTYTINTLVDFFLNDKIANPFGFSYRVYGDFDKQQVENLGGCSGRDMISKIISTWPGTIVYPKRKTLYIFAPDAFHKNYDRRIVYKYNSSSIKLTEDSTGIINQIRAVGATKDDEGTSDGGDTGQNQAGTPDVTAGVNLDSPENFAKSPINASFGVNKDAMIRDFANRSQKVRARGVDVNRLYDTVKNAGVAPEWFFAYELQEQNSNMGWLNHWAYPHGDPYNDATVVCGWIKQWANTDSIQPAWSAAEGSINPDPSLTIRWNNEFPKGTIGRLYLQATAAAVWELAGRSGNAQIGKPLQGCLNQIKAWGGHNYVAPSSSGDESSGGDQTTAQLTQTSKTIISGQDNTAAFQADAKKYLGVPYVWGGAGGARGGNPFSGMDCSSYVSQVYQDFGIHIPAQTIAMEPSFREIPYSEAKAGDVGFYGPHGGTHHICLLLDHNTQIYEPEPGESCKMASIASFPPTWYGRNDAMQAKINTKKVETVPVANISFHDDFSPTTASTTSTTNNTVTSYYFQPFIVQDDHSIDVWGLHPGPDIQDDRFKDPDAMAEYAKKQLVPDPVISVEVTLDTNTTPIPGEEAYLTIPERGTLIEGSDMTTQSSYNTTVTAVGFTWYPFDPTQGTDITYDNLQATILHANNFNMNLQSVESLVNAALDRMPQVFYGKKDPTIDHVVHNGAIWTRVEYDRQGGETVNGGKQSGQDNAGTGTNKPK